MLVKKIDAYTKFVSIYGAKGLPYIKVNDKSDLAEGLQSPIVKFLPADVCQAILDRVGAENGDLIFFGADTSKVVSEALGALRCQLGEDLNLYTCEWAPLWVVDFPMFEKTDEGRWTFTHNPFSMPAVVDLEKHMNGKEEEIGSIIAQQYDLILNGYEIGGGSVRAHKPEILEATYKNMGYNKEEMLKSVGTMLKY